MKRKIPIGSKILYGSGAAAFGIKDQGFQALLLIYYNQVLGLPALLVSSALMIALLLDGIMDPLIGHVSDNWRSSLGRRHPFMYASLIPICITFYMVWNPPQIEGMALFTYLIISSVLLRGFLSVYEIPNASLLPELTQNYNERTVLFSIRHLFNIIGGVGMGIAAFAIFLSPTEEFPVGQLNPEGYTNYSLVALLFIALSILASSLGTQSIARNFHKPEKRPSTPGSKFGGIWAVVANKALLSMLGTGMFAALAAGMIHALQVYMGTYYWELDNQDLAAIQGVSLVSILVAVVAATPLSAKFGKKETAVFMLLFVILGFSAPILLREFGLFPANGSDLLLPLILIERGTVTAASLTLIILASSMVADIVEDVEEKTGRRAEGLVQSVNTLVAKTVSGMGILAAGSVLAFIAFPDEATPGAISPDTLTSLGFTYIGVGIVFFSGSLLCLATYPLSRAGHEARLARLVRTTSETSVTTSD